MSNIYTVNQINNYIKNMFDHDYLLQKIAVKGELSNVKYHSSGHIYFSLKDEGGNLTGVMFRGSRANGLDFTMENGQCVIVKGNISVYERDGKYQIYAREITLYGVGDLNEAYNQLKNKLYEEGLFEFEDKKPIPQYPKKVGIVTARTGAALQDICNIAKRRNPYVQLVLYPAKVQGDGAAQTIVQGIETLDAMGLDTIIIGRGGGSIEDLWAFNEEIVARAIYAAHTPIISGTGHEIDNTIADYVADLRAPTPSAACELAIPDVMSSLHLLNQYDSRLRQITQGKISKVKQQLEILGIKLHRVSPVSRLDNQKIYMDQLTDRLHQSMTRKYEKRMNQYEILLTKLNGLSPTAKLVGGYGYITTRQETPISSVHMVKESDVMTVTVWDGEITARIIDVKEQDTNG